MAAKDALTASIRNAMADHLGIRVKEIAAMFGINRNTAGQHIDRVRAEWDKPEGKAE